MICNKGDHLYLADEELARDVKELYEERRKKLSDRIKKESEESNINEEEKEESDTIKLQYLIIRPKVNTFTIICIVLIGKLIKFISNSIIIFYSKVLYNNKNER